MRSSLPLCRPCWFGSRFYRAARDYLAELRR
jgi:hypothetical protein